MSVRIVNWVGDVRITGWISAALASCFRDLLGKWAWAWRASGAIGTSSDRGEERLAVCERGKQVVANVSEWDRGEHEAVEATATGAAVLGVKKLLVYFRMIPFWRFGDSYARYRHCTCRPR